MFLDVFSFSSKGGRCNNQDAVGCDSYSENAVLVVADGLGGHLHGKKAAECAVQTMLSHPITDNEDPILWLKSRFEQANTNILNLQEEYRAVMKSTAVTLLISGKQACWGHVGDSRLYYLHNKDVAGITNDHSVAYKKYLSGEITREQIGVDEDQSSLLRTLGDPTRSEPDCYALEHCLESGDGFLLCSDGLWEYLMDEEILIDFLKADCAQMWGELLLLRVMERISTKNDNLSLITVMVKTN